MQPTPSSHTTAVPAWQVPEPSQVSSPLQNSPSGQEVAAGDQLAVIEAMKMQTPITAEAAGTVATVSVKVGQSLQPGDKIVKIDLTD